MPKRSNQYQKLVRRIVEQLSDDDTEVTESKMLIDRDSGAEREVDLYIKDTAGPFPVTVGIECTATKRKVDLPKIEQLHAKHQRLDIGHTVIVSKAGFAKKAKAYGAKNHIQLLEFNEADDMCWPDWFASIKKLALSHIRLEVKAIEGVITNQSTEEFDLTNEITVQSDALGPVSLADFAYYLHRTKPGKIIAQGNNKTETWRLDPNQKVLDINRVEGSCSELTLIYSESTNEIPLNLKYGEFLGKPFAYGTTKAPIGAGTLSTIVSRAGSSAENGNPKFNITMHIDTES